MGCCGHGGMMIGGMHGRLSKLACICQYEKHADMLELSDEQLASLKDIRMASRKAAIQARADIQIVELELDEILKEDMPDLTEVKAKISAIAALRKDMALARVNTLEKARKILTTEQLAKLKALKKKARAKKAETYKKTGERAKKRVLKKTEKEAGEKKIMKKKSETSESQ
ncbi:MAG: hypothetical protein AMJ46_10140 [Latescibacteria bacterium DG_63]|nr:MAG: hypothetical protein AMJ46_10140 [Latescibacteria bacterium DG_63]